MVSLATLAWLRIEPSLAALGFAFAEIAVDQSTTFAWPIVYAVAGAASGVGLAVGVLRKSVATLTETVQELKAALAREREAREAGDASERAAREKDDEAWDAFKTATLVTLTKLQTLSDQKSGAQIIAAAIDKLDRRSDSPRPRDHDQTNPRSRRG